ncbi:Uncharacterized protein Cus16_3197 [Curtobacterium sp. ER1/6]|nr:Uncharacterized protein Cus16_3197 [Curtobacterium sp. ER1/6]
MDERYRCTRRTGGPWRIRHGPPVRRAAGLAARLLRGDREDVAGGHALLDLLEGAPTALGHEPPDEQEREDPDGGEAEEGARDAGGGDDGREVQAEEGVRDPEAEHRDPHAERADLRREDLGQDDPHRDVEEGLHRADERDDEEQDHPGTGGVAGHEHHRGDPDEEVADGRQREPDDERRAAVDALHVRDGDEAADHRDDTGCDVGDECRLLLEARLDEHRLAVVHDRVDAGELLRDAEPRADEDDADEPLVAEQHPPPALLLDLRLDVVGPLDVLELRGRALLGADLRQHRPSLAVPPLRREPARRLRHAEHPDEERDRRQGADGEHDAPDAVALAPEAADDGVHDERGELTDDDHELVPARERPADLVRREFGQEHRHHGRRPADRETEEHPADDDDPEGRGEHTDQGADEERDGEQDDRAATTPPVGDPTAEHRPDRGTEEQGTRDHALGDRRQPELVGHRPEGTVDHAGVVAEEQAAEGRHEGEHAEAAAVRPLADRGQCDARLRRLDIDHSDDSFVG